LERGGKNDHSFSSPRQIWENLATKGTIAKLKRGRIPRFFSGGEGMTWTGRRNQKKGDTQLREGGEEGTDPGRK